MSIRRFFDKTVTVQRLKNIDGTRSGFYSTATADGAIQELSAEARQTIGIVEGRAWRAWFDEDVNIQEGDKITDSNGVIYKVREVTTKDYGINRHREVIMEEYNA